jgi:hypothetical protein
LFWVGFEVGVALAEEQPTTSAPMAMRPRMPLTDLFKVPAAFRSGLSGPHVGWSL